MTRQRVNSPSHHRGITRKGGARFTSPATPQKPRRAVPVADGLAECPHCHGGVRIIGAPFTNPEVDIRRGDPVIAGHTFGGGSVTRTKVPCLGAWTPIEDET